MRKPNVRKSLPIAVFGVGLAMLGFAVAGVSVDDAQGVANTQSTHTVTVTVPTTVVRYRHTSAT